MRVYDTATYEELPSLPSGPDPELFVLHPSGNPLYIANEDDNLVTVVDVETRQVLAEVPVGVEPEGMGVSPDGKIVVNTSETTNMAHLIDTETLRDRRQRARRLAAALRRVHARRQAARSSPPRSAARSA